MVSISFRIESPCTMSKYRHDQLQKHVDNPVRFDVHLYIHTHATKYHSSPNEYIWGKNKFSSHFQIMDIKANQHCHYFVSMSANCVSYNLFLCFFKKVFSIFPLYNFHVIRLDSLGNTGQINFKTTCSIDESEEINLYTTLLIGIVFT